MAPRHPLRPSDRRRGFTLLEMLMAVMILAILTTITAITFTSVLNNWKKSVDVVDRMQTADYAFNQIVSGLRSAYYPTDGNQNEKWGFQLYDNGEGEDEGDSDVICWTKLGTAIVGDKLQAAETSHFVQLWVQKGDHDEPGGLYVKTWTPDLVNENAREYDEDELGDEFLLVQDVVGFDCQVQKTPTETEEDGRPKWEETWDTSNAIPYRVKLTFRMKPAEGAKESIPVMRVVQIPLWDISQNPLNANETGKEGARTVGGKKSGSGTTGGNTTGGGTKSGGATGGGTKGGAIPGGGTRGGATGGRMGGGGAAGGTGGPIGGVPPGGGMR